MTGTRFIYASSAATYGDGDAGFLDDGSLPALKKLRPMNLYGWSKHQFDLVIADRVAKRQPLPPQWAGLKFFNVYGPNEYHKGAMMSVLCKVFDEAKSGKPVRLFKSHRAGVLDGDQRRDFIYVDDVTAVVHWLLESPSGNGIFNVGTGRAQSFREMIEAMFSALGRPSNIEYIDMPLTIRDTYQYFTEASVENLRRAGYNAGFTSARNGRPALRSRVPRPLRPVQVAMTETLDRSPVDREEKPRTGPAEVELGSEVRAPRSETPLGFVREMQRIKFRMPRDFRELFQLLAYYNSDRGLDDLLDLVEGTRTVIWAPPATPAFPDSCSPAARFPRFWNVVWPI